MTHNTDNLSDLDKLRLAINERNLATLATIRQRLDSIIHNVRAAEGTKVLVSARAWIAADWASTL